MLAPKTNTIYAPCILYQWRYLYCKHLTWRAIHRRCPVREREREREQSRGRDQQIWAWSRVHVVFRSTALAHSSSSWINYTADL